MTIRTILVDDEKLAIQGLQLRLEPFDDVEIIETCQNGREAIRAIKTLKPDLVFLDIQMPGFDGFSVIQGLMEVEPPLFVFVTAYSDHAIRAFEAGAADYLLKPVQDARLAQAVERMRARLAEARAPDMRSLIDDLEARLRPQGGRLIRWITASVGDSVRMIAIDEVLFFQAQDKYVRVVTAEGEALIRTPIKDLLAGLDPDVFWQVHRGSVVRVSTIARVRRDELGRSRIELRGHRETLPVSAAFVHRFRGM